MYSLKNRNLINIGKYQNNVHFQFKPILYVCFQCFVKASISKNDLMGVLIHSKKNIYYFAVFCDKSVSGLKRKCSIVEMFI